MLRNKFFVALTLLCATAFTGCKKELLDGDWPPIQITVNGKECKSCTYVVPETGGEYKIYSKNYGGLWLLSVTENDTKVWPEGYDWSNFQEIHLTGEWYEVQYDDIHNIVVTINPKESSTAPRSLDFRVEVGDAFGHVTLVQE